MWLEKEFQYYDINLNHSKFDESTYNLYVQNEIREWNEMRDKRENGEISDNKYIEWKLNYNLYN